MVESCIVLAQFTRQFSFAHIYAHVSHMAAGSIFYIPVLHWPFVLPVGDGSSTHLQHAFMHMEDSIFFIYIYDEYAEYGRGNQSSCTCACRCTYEGTTVPAAFTEIKLHFRNAHGHKRTLTQQTAYDTCDRITFLLCHCLFIYIKPCIHIWLRAFTGAVHRKQQQQQRCMFIYKFTFSLLHSA